MSAALGEGAAQIEALDRLIDIVQVEVQNTSEHDVMRIVSLKKALRALREAQDLARLRTDHAGNTRS